MDVSRYSEARPPSSLTGGLGHIPDVQACDRDSEIRFRRFRLLPHCRVLLCDGRAVELGSRAFDLIHLLASSRGQVVSKDEIVSRVWPTTVVDECNLRLQVTKLRKALGEDRDLIKTIPGRGYLFAADVPGEDVASFVGGGVDGPETCEALRSLLRSVLDELRQMTLELR
jgi:DNA-binding winged helix-turn-helix (wHTH) protein